MTSMIVVSCISTPSVESSNFHANNFNDIKLEVKKSKNSFIDDYGKNGPFNYSISKNLKFKKKSRNFSYDLISPITQGPAPLVIISHGNYGHKEAHRFQAERIASWGLNAITLQLPKKKQWLENGNRIHEFVSYISNHSSKISNKIDPKNIVLVGHSFGGSAVTIAAGKRAPIKGLILLDPAMVHKKVIPYMKKVSVPTILIGADVARYRSKNRELFFSNIKSEIVETSIIGATHWDAQYPTMTQMFKFNIGETASTKMQEKFLKIIVSASLSLSINQDTSSTWTYLKELKTLGDVMKNKKKNASVKRLKISAINY